MHFPWPDAKITFEVNGKNLTLDIENESPVPPDQKGIFEDYDDLSGIYNEHLDYEVIKCVKYRRDGDLILESTYGGFTIIEINEKTNLCKERDSWIRLRNRRTILFVFFWTDYSTDTSIRLNSRAKKEQFHSLIMKSILYQIGSKNSQPNMVHWRIFGREIFTAVHSINRCQ